MMKSLFYKTLLVVFMGCAAAPNGLEAEVTSGAGDIELTIYNDNLALVKQVYGVSLEKGFNEIRLEGVAGLMDPSSVLVKSLKNSGGLSILEQNFEYDLLNYGKLLEKYVGREVEVHQQSDDGSGKTHIQKGILLSSGYSVQPAHSSGWGRRYNFGQVGSPMVEIDGKIHTGITGHLVLPELPEDLIMKPTLSWDLESSKNIEDHLQLTYLTQGITWEANYVISVNAGDDLLDLNGWVTLDNRSGTKYENAKLKLIAGDVNRVQQHQPKVRRDMVMMEMAMASGAPQFQEESFFEYHLYKLQRPASVKNNEMKQIELLQASNVSVKKKFVYENGDKVKVNLEFKNSEKEGMGLPLPKGKIRIYKKDSEGSQQFIGEDRIDHTPKDEEIELFVGNAFDIKGEMRQINYNVIRQGKVAEETFEVKLRNHKDEDIEVDVVQHLHRSREWKIVKSTHEFEKETSTKMVATVPVPKDGEVVIQYTVKYQW